MLERLCGLLKTEEGRDIILYSENDCLRPVEILRVSDGVSRRLYMSSSRILKSFLKKIRNDT